MKMKLSKDLFYGIIIGILLFASIGSIKKDKAEFKNEIVMKCESYVKANQKMAQMKNVGYTVLDYEIGSDGHYVHFGD